MADRCRRCGLEAATDADWAHHVDLNGAPCERARCRTLCWDGAACIRPPAPPREIAVTSCAGCEWVDGARCKPPAPLVGAERQGVIASYHDDSPPPEDCPLRAGPVVVRIKEGI